MRLKWFKWILLTGGAVALFLRLYEAPVESPSWEQPTMGTLCHITLSGPMPKNKLKRLRAELDAALEDVNRRMSTWQEDTEISQFNRFHPPSPEGCGATGSLEKFPISPEFADVVRAALFYAELTGGAFDPTVKPLVDFWGFGPEKTSKNEHQTTNEELTRIMEAVGWEKVRLVEEALIKTHPAVELDLSAIAKGYGADRAGDVIEAAGVTNFLVEIGGEIAAAGSAPSGGPWRVGIENPDPHKAFGESLFQTLEISDLAMATSGDYRNFRTRADGTRYSHILDPRSGRPAESDVAAVTVLAERCMDADAVATALFVMGSETGFQWLETHPEFEAFFILHAPDGGFVSRSTMSGEQALIDTTSPVLSGKKSEMRQ